MIDWKHISLEGLAAFVAEQLRHQEFGLFKKII